jgi:hypothetical protein
MAKGAPNRTTGGGKMGSGKAVVGYGLKGKAFKNPAKYNASKSGQLHAKNPGLSNKPVGKGAEGNVFFSKANYAKSQVGRLSGQGGPAKVPHHSPGQAAHFATAEVSKPTPVPKTPAGMKANPVARARGVK